MTTLTAPTAPATAAPALRALLAVDGVGTALVGVAALVLAEPLSEHLASTGVLRGVGVLFVVIGADMLLARRLQGRRLAVAATALGVLDLTWAAATTAALPLLDATATGTAVVLAVAATCVGMGTGKLVLVRRLRD